MRYFFGPFLQAYFAPSFLVYLFCDPAMADGSSKVYLLKHSIAPLGLQQNPEYVTTLGLRKNHKGCEFRKVKKSAQKSTQKSKTTFLSGSKKETHSKKYSKK